MWDPGEWKKLNGEVEEDPCMIGNAFKKNLTFQYYKGYVLTGSLNKNYALAIPFNEPVLAHYKMKK